MRNKKLWILLAAAVAVVGVASVYAWQNPEQIATITKVATGPVVPLTMTVPAGTPIEITLQMTLSTKTAAVGDRFSAVVAAPVVQNGKTLIPAGAEIEGAVALAEQPGKASGRGRLQLAYETVRFGGRTYKLGSHSQIYESASGTGKDAALIGGGAVAGGVVGGIVGGSAGSAAKGAVVGAATGTAASLLTRGPQLEIESGTKLHFTLDQDVVVHPPIAA